MPTTGDPVMFIGYGLFALLILYLIALWDGKIAMTLGLLIVVAAIFAWGSAWQKN